MTCDWIEAWTLTAVPERNRMTAQPLRSLEGERNKLWTKARRKGLAAGTPERDRIAAMDDRIRALKAELRR